MSRAPRDPRGWNKPDGTPLTGREVMEGMKDKPKTKADKARAVTEAATASLSGAQRARREAEAALMDLEDRTARREARRSRRRRR